MSKTKRYSVSWKVGPKAKPTHIRLAIIQLRALADRLQEMLEKAEADA